MTESYRLGHRPALDALRGIAVILVVVSHSLWSDPGSGGPVGVTLFFVLSGFLITRLLVEERETTGRLSLRDFWWRRAARLLPALALLLVTLAIAGVPLPALAAAAFYVADIPQIVEAVAPGAALSGAHLDIVDGGAVLPGLADRRATRAQAPHARLDSRRHCGSALRRARLGHVSSRWAGRPTPAQRDLRPDALVIGCLLALVIDRFPRWRLLPVLGALLVGLTAFTPDLARSRLGLTVAAVASAVLVGWAATSASHLFAWRPLTELLDGSPTASTSGIPDRSHPGSHTPGWPPCRCPSLSIAGGLTFVDSWSNPPRMRFCGRGVTGLT